MKVIIVSIFLIIFINLPATCGPNGAPYVSDNFLNHIQGSQIDSEGYAQWVEQQQEHAQQLADQEQAKKDEFLRQEAETKRQLNALKTDAITKAWEYTNAENQIGFLTNSFLNAKLIIPKDPWRIISNEKIYTKSRDSGFVKFDGRIIEIETNLMRLEGNFGDNTNIEFLVMNFPYNCNEGEIINSSNLYVALINGDFSYVTTDGSGKTIPKLNYGVPCLRPPNADQVEMEARELTPEEENQIKAAKANAFAKLNDALAANENFNVFIKKVEDEQKARILAEHASLDKALKFNQDQADNGDPVGLLRMAERYRDGEGVPKDINKSIDLFKKAIAAGSPTATNELLKLNQSQSPLAIKNEPSN